MKISSLQQSPALRPFVRQFVGLAAVTRRTCQHNVIWRVRATTRYGYDMLYMKPVFKGCVTTPIIVATPLLPLVLTAHICFCQSSFGLIEAKSVTMNQVVLLHILTVLASSSIYVFRPPMLKPSGAFRLCLVLMALVVRAIDFVRSIGVFLAPFGGALVHTRLTKRVKSVGTMAFVGQLCEWLPFTALAANFANRIGQVKHSVSLSLYHKMLVSGGVICRRFGCTSLDTTINYSIFARITPCHA